jgi:hemerythrin-like domain-containing protein
LPYWIRKRMEQGQPSRAAVAAEFRTCLSAKDRFCNQLEAIADLLPAAVDVRDCLIIAQNIVPVVKRAHDFEETVVYPLLLSGTGDFVELAVWIERLKFEHMGDEDFASELCLALREFATDRKRANVESLSWMLRGFFEGLRRHIAFERTNLLPLLESTETRGQQPY